MGEIMIWKYAIPLMDDFPMRLPVGATILTFDTQGPNMYIWVQFDLVSGESVRPEFETRHFSIVGTGNRTDGDGLTYIGTVKLNGFVWHLYEVEQEE